ncbi:phage tail domain-containing protein [Arthrobacter sp. AL12]|uniref:phage distal tail protein n=1 Tax=Arthrobacter sp. AL12 TaxID=3042241 RepID=UPI00249A745D|nr:phage tail domain-containing protein [Arthrobacter sp. AL12]MDI3211759.1 phage tail family protein [Arthrobacter sp. AL12]
MIGVSYGDFNMQANGVTVTATDVYSAPTNSIQADELAERDGALIVQQKFQKKAFKVEGLIRKATQQELEQTLDAFKLAMSKKNQGFDVAYAGGIRRYLASVQNNIISSRGITSVGFSIEFLSPDGMGWDLESTSLITSASNTTSNTTVSLSVGGSYKADPYIKVTVGAVTGGTSKTITLSNAATLRSIAVTRTWVAGDVLEVDTLKGLVLVNGAAHDFTGQLLSFEPGDGGLGYLDDFTTRSITITSSYTRRWL